MPEEVGPVDLAQVERYEFTVEFPATSLPQLTVDEPAPVGRGAGPDPVRTLAMAIGHCMSSTFFHSLDRARVPVGPIRTRVLATVGPNERGRRRVQGLRVEIRAQPLHEEDRPRFDQCVAIFADYCTVSGAVREGIPIASDVRPPDAPP